MGGLALAFPHERAVAKLARRFRGGRRRSFVVCVGASDELRTRVEAALGERLGDRAVASVTVRKDEKDPWGALLGGRSGEAWLVSARLDDKIEDRALRLLDVQREVLQGEGLSLMLWVSLGEMERVASLAPNLWSYRSDVAWFLSHAGIEASVGEGIEEGPAVPSIEEQLQRVEEELKWKRSQRADALIDKAWLLHRFGRMQEALAMLKEVKPHIRANSRDEQIWRTVNLKILRTQKRLSDARSFAEAGRNKNAPKERVLERVEVAFDSTEWRAAFTRLEQVLLSAFRWEAFLLENELGPTCVDAAESLVRLGRLAAAERWLHEATKTIARRSTGWWPMVAAYVERARADVAWERLDTITSLRHLQRCLRYGERHGALDLQAEVIGQIAERYEELGLPRERHLFRDRAKQVSDRLHADPSLSSTPDEVEPPIDTPFTRLERAVRAAVKVLDEGRASDAAAALDACAEAWSAEDERYRSLRLFDRWQQALARHLVARGDEERAVTVLRDAAEQLRDLPRTRLGTLLALAKLPVGDAHASVREAAAQEVLSQALAAGALALERDARRALAPFARQRGDVEEADFHEAEADRIAAALDLPAPAEAETAAPPPDVPAAG